MAITLEQLRGSIESTLLAATATERDVEALCSEAAEHGFHGVCVAPCRVARAVAFLEGTPVRVVSVAGFPLGSQTTRAKVAEVAELVALGAAEVDLVMNVGWFLDGRLAPVSQELREARAAARGAVFKVILETAALGPNRVREAAALALGAGADFLKTSTGYGSGGATLPDVRALKQVAGSRCGIKASAGIRSFPQARDLIAAGADRIGTSAAGTIWREAQLALGED